MARDGAIELRGSEEAGYLAIAARGVWPETPRFSADRYYQIKGRSQKEQYKSDKAARKPEEDDPEMGGEPGNREA